MKKNALSKAVKSTLDKQAKAKEKKQYVDSLLAASKNDSANVLAVEPDSSVADSAVLEADADSVSVPQLPTPEQLGISISTGHSGDTLQVAVGDTVEFPVTVSWNASNGSILVLPMSTANAKDLVQVGMSQESSRIVKDGHEIAQITFKYKLVAKEEGITVVPAMRFEIPTQIGQSLSLRTDPVPLYATSRVETFTTVLVILIAVFWVLVAVWRLRRRAKAKVAANQAIDALYAIRERMMVLKQRVNVADSREWLLELEGICKDFMALRLGKDVSAVNLDNLVKDGKLEGWEHLVEEFAHARYGGGKRDGFENKETWKLAMTLMGIKEDE